MGTIASCCGLFIKYHFFFPGNWKFLDSLNSSSKFQDFQKSNGNSVVELVAVPTKITGVHYVQVNSSPCKVLYYRIVLDYSMQYLNL